MSFLGFSLVTYEKWQQALAWPSLAELLNIPRS